MKIAPMVKVEQNFTLEEINSITRFPSFFTPFLRLGKEDEVPREHRHKCMGELVADLSDIKFHATEKIDGSNVRFVFWLEGNSLEIVLGVVGTRKILVHAPAESLDDVKLNQPGGFLANREIWRKVKGLFGTLRASVQKLVAAVPYPPPNMVAFYFELCGKGIQKRGDLYADEPTFKLFAIRTFPLDWVRPATEAAHIPMGTLRRRACFPFVTWGKLVSFAADAKLSTPPLLGQIDGATIKAPIDAKLILNTYLPLFREDREGVVLWPTAPAPDYRHPKEGWCYPVFKIKWKDYPQ